MGGQGHCKMPLLRELARRCCLTDVSEANIGSSAAPPIEQAPQVARSEAQGQSKRGRLSFAYFASAGDPVAEQRKVGALPGAYPGIQPNQKTSANYPSRIQKIIQPQLTLLPPERRAPKGSGKL